MHFIAQHLLLHCYTATIFCAILTIYTFNLHNRPFPYISQSQNTQIHCVQTEKHSIKVNHRQQHGKSLWSHNLAHSFTTRCWTCTKRYFLTVPISPLFFRVKGNCPESLDSSTTYVWAHCSHWSPLIYDDYKPHDGFNFSRKLPKATSFRQSSTRLCPTTKHPLNENPLEILVRVILMGCAVVHPTLCQKASILYCPLQPQPCVCCCLCTYPVHPA